MAKKINIKKLATHASRIAIIVVVLFLAVYMIALISQTTEYYGQSAERSAKIYFNEDMKKASALAEQHYARLYEIVDKVCYAKTKEAVDEVFMSYINSEEFGDLRYYAQEVTYSPMGDVIERETAAHELLQELSSQNVPGCTPVYFDEKVQVDCIAFFVPVRGSLFVDGVLSIVPAKNIITVGEVINEKTSSIAILRSDGKVFDSKSAEGFRSEVGANYYDFLDAFTADKDMVDTARTVISDFELGSTEISAAGTRYTLVAEPMEAFDGHLTLVTLSVSDHLILSEVNYIRHIVNILVLAIIAFLVGLTYAVLFQKKAKEALSTANLSDATIECANIEGFRRNAMNLTYSGSRRFAIATVSMRQYRFIEDNFGHETTVDILKFISHVLSTFCTNRETYGYAGEGRFLIYVDYVDEPSFREKLLVFENIVNKYDVLVTNKLRLKMTAGLCLSFGGKRRTLPEMIECSTMMCEQAQADIKISYLIYTDVVRDKITRNEQIEAQMEGALQDNEFRLFLQPKYNVAGDCVDSAEALVRWFDPQKGDYIYPGEFIALFEANGFISKLDHFVYLEVLKFLSSSLEKGDKVIPISVNVSRVTATSSDFINFYVGNKRKYQIDDGLITLEFTESFAVEDYAKLAEIVNSLHEGGIRCSIDDFGVGYSSFSVLKELAMDELKLDRLFLTPGSDAGRDDKIINTIATLAKDMGMTVVQEGVETKEMFDRVVGMGIGVVQGYYYAKAISVEEYRIFIKSNTSIRYKAIVK